MALAVSAVPVYQFVAIAESGCSIMSQRDHRRVGVSKDCIDRAVGRHGPLVLFGHVSDASMNGGSGSSRLLQSHALNERDKIGGHAMPVRIAPNGRD